MLHADVNGNLVFSPKDVNESIKMHVSMHHIENKSTHSDSKFNSDNKSNCTYPATFYIFVENISFEHTHLNKNAHIGYLSTIDDIKPIHQNCNSNSPHEVINVITPSPEVIKQKREEFDLRNFKFNHLNSSQKPKISEILESNSQVFSSSLKTIRHTDLIVPKINFTSDCPIKCLPFPVPQALQAEVRRQLQELEEAGIIERNLSNWGCPMLIVKKKSPDGKSKQTYHLALDLCLFNTIIEDSSYPLPKIQDLISNLAKFLFFSRHWICQVRTTNWTY